MDGRKVILVVDDEVVLLDSIHTFLRDEGFEVLEAGDGNEALRLSETHGGTIDLLLVDLEMPRLDVISAYRRIRAARPDIKVLFMSGHFPKSLEIPTESPFLTKPFVRAALCTKVREVLEMPVSGFRG